MRISLIQHNVKLGDYAAIDAAIDQHAQHARQNDVDLLVFPERFLIGGPGGDFSTRKETLAHCAQRLNRIASQHRDGPAMLIGTPWQTPDSTGKTAYNAVALVHQGSVRIVHQQNAVPSYGVQQYAQHFEPSDKTEPFELRGHTIGVLIGNDLWNQSDVWQRPAQPQAVAHALAPACDFLIHLDADPWFPERPQERFQKLQSIAQTYERAIIHVNHFGSAQTILYDGRSMILDAQGNARTIARSFDNDVQTFDIPTLSKAEATEVSQELYRDPVDETLDALIFGLKDNVHKSGFKDVVLGLSGGIDSAIVAAIAVEALGAEHVYGVAMPSRYSSDHSIQDAKDLANNLKMPFDVMEIEAVHQALLQTLAPFFEGTQEDTAEENLQARARGVLLMGLSNKFNRLLLATSNKSEFAVGYSTLYGDMAGAFAPLTDVPKEMVYAISRRFNERRGFDAIPISTLTKPPSAELRPDQTDQDSLPPYEILDELIDRYVVRGQSAQEIVDAGFDPVDVRRVVWLVNITGYKRQQAAPGLRVSRQALAIGRDFPSIGNFSSLNLPAQD